MNINDNENEKCEIKNALEELELSVSPTLSPILYLTFISSLDIKKQYYKLALRWHPDKNGQSEESKQKFQRINRAYELLQNISKNQENIDIDLDENNENVDIKTNKYADLLKIFLKSKCPENIYAIINKILLQKDLDTDTSFSLKHLINLDKQTIETIFQLLTKYKDILHISDTILKLISFLCGCNYSAESSFSSNDENTEGKHILNVGLKDIFENNVYKLVINENTYMVPTWHHELHFEEILTEDNQDVKKIKDIIVVCEPVLPKGFTIDENNNLFIETHLTMKEMVTLIETNGCIQCSLYDKKVFEIPIDKLYMKKSQMYRFKRAGISRIIEKNIYQTEKKADVYIHIILSLL